MNNTFKNNFDHLVDAVNNVSDDEFSEAEKEMLNKVLVSAINNANDSHGDDVFEEGKVDKNFRNEAWYFIVLASLDSYNEDTTNYALIFDADLETYSKIVGFIEKVSSKYYLSNREASKSTNPET